MSLAARVQGQLQDAFRACKADGWTLLDLSKAVRKVDRRVRLDAPALSRKLRGETALGIDEAAAIASALGVTLDLRCGA